MRKKIYPKGSLSRRDLYEMGKVEYFELIFWLQSFALQPMICYVSEYLPDMIADRQAGNPETREK